MIKESKFRELRKLKLGRRAEKILQEIESSNTIQRNSSQILLFHVEDLLGMAQLKCGKFRKNESKFNIKKAVEDIIEIQQYSADQKNIKIDVEYSIYRK